MTITIELWMFYSALAFLLGLLGGLYLGQRVNPSVRRIKQLEVELEKTRDLLADQRERVARHFSRTCELFDTLTKDYRTVYQHLADGCVELCGDRVPRFSQEMTLSRAVPVVSAQSLAGTVSLASPLHPIGQTVTGGGVLAVASQPVASAQSLAGTTALAVEVEGECSLQPDSPAGEHSPLH